VSFLILQQEVGLAMKSSEKGAVLVVILVLSAVALMIMTALIYMISTGTRVSGLQKRYQTALEAGHGAADLFYQIIALRGQTADVNSFTDNLNTFGMNAVVNKPAACTGTSGGTTYYDIQAKLMTSDLTWNVPGCNKALNIDPGDPTTYDMKAELGTTTKYNVYAKIVATSDGNSGADTGLLNKGVVTANTGEVTVQSIPYLYTMEVVSENVANPDERAKLSILYQY
jgi:type II secretory pathway pseudopilin PulG